MSGRTFRTWFPAAVVLAAAVLMRSAAALDDPLKPAPEVSALLAAADSARQARRLDEALRLLDEALVRARSLKDGVGEARAHMAYALHWYNQGLRQQALEPVEQALSAARTARDQQTEAAALGLSGAILDSLGEKRRAMTRLDEAIAFDRQIGAKREEAFAQNSLGIMYHNMGEWREAEECYRQCLALRREIGYTRGEAMTMGNMAGLMVDSGRIRQAMTLYEENRRFAAAGKHRDIVANTLAGMGNVHRKVGQPQRALECETEALALARELRDRALEALVLSNMGITYHELGDLTRERECLEQSLEIKRSLGNPRSEIATLVALATLDGFMGDHRTAIETLQRAQGLCRKVSSRQQEGVVLVNISHAWHLSGDHRQALTAAQGALQMLAAAPSQYLEVSARARLADAYDGLGRAADAERQRKAAVAMLEEMRRSLSGMADAQSGLLADQLVVYRQYLWALLRRGNPTAAFVAAQQTKARALVDLMGSGRASVERVLSSEERQRVRELQEQLASLNQQMVAEAVSKDPGAVGRSQQTKDRVAQSERELAAYMDALYARHPDLAGKRAATTITLADVAKLLPPDTALLEYVVLRLSRRKNGVDKTVLFVVTSDGRRAQATALDIPVTKADLAERADDLREACADPKRSFQAKARDLYRLLVAPAAKLIAGKKRLIVCPDGALWGVPFQALTAPDGRSLLDRFDISYAYSATCAQAAMRSRARPSRPKAEGTLFAVANPDFGGEARFGAPAPPDDGRPITVDARNIILPRGWGLSMLPWTQREADALARGFPDGRVLTGTGAQEDTAKREAGKYRYVHFATHGLFNDAAPMMSAIVLASPSKGSEEDGFLTARELLDMDLRADLVTLSACNTARGEQRPGEGIVGLSWALFVAGSPSQVVSQWAVNDAATATLMERFYGGLRAGRSKAAALRLAALSLSKDGAHSHPYYWAPFVLMGDWR